jgi:hypothetical protein
MKPFRSFRFRAAALAWCVSLGASGGNAFAAATLELTAGWNLLGNSSTAPIDVAAAFGDATRITTVWKWNRQAGVWALYAPSLSSAGLTLYAQDKGYEVLSSIEPKEGFWIQAPAPVSLTGQEAGAVTLTEGDLQQGWNLVASADNKSPALLHQGLSAGLKAAGKAMVTAWAWDAPSARWKFYAPALDAQGGTAWSDYAAGRSYLLFDTAPAATEGFWLNLGAGLNDSLPRLTPFATSAELERFLKDALERSVSATSDYRYDVAIATSSTSTTGGSGTPSNFSGTNLQEAGVDEADRFKSDGRYLYVLGSDANSAGSGLSILALADTAPAKASYIARLTLDSQKVFSQSYLATGRPDGQPDLLLALSGSGSDTYPVPGMPTITLASERSWFSPWDWRKGQVELQWVDIANRAQPEATTRLALDGFLVASRRIGETIFLVTRFYPSIPNVISDPDPTKQAAAELLALQQASLAELLPKWYLNGAEQGNLISASTCYQAPGDAARQTPDLIVVAAIDIGNPNAAPRAQCLSGSSETVYVSTEALYVATTRYNYSVTASTSALGGSTSTLIASYPAESATDLHKFSLSAAGPQYRGSGSVAGHLGWEQDKKSFRMGEHQGALRIATSVGETWDASATHRLSVLREQDGVLALVGQLPNELRPAPLGKPGEKIYAARFVGNRGYLVTFRVTDPLYVIDLADPADPRIAGELQIPGYSDYLHPIGEEWLLGVGKDALADTVSSWGDGRGAWYQGVKIALFNVADASQPKEVSSVVIGRRGTQSAALADHHAFSFLPMVDNGDALGRFALPIERHATPPAYNYYEAGDPRTYYDWSDTGLYLFSVSRNGLSQQGEVRVEQRSETATYPSYSGGDRALLRADEVHYLHGLEVWSAPWADSSSPIKAQ